MITINRKDLMSSKGHIQMPFFDITKLKQENLSNIEEIIYDVVASKGDSNETIDKR